MFYSSEDVPKALFSPLLATECSSLFQPWVALHFGFYNRSICLILRMKIWHKTQQTVDLLNPGNEWSTRDTMARGWWWEPYGSGGTRDSLLSCGKSARWWLENRRSREREHTKSTSFLSLKKNRRHKFNWLINARRRVLAVNWLGAHKTNAGTCLAWLARAALSARCHIIENVFYYCKTSCFTVAILCPGQRLMEH